GAGPSQEGVDFNVQGWRLSNDGSADEIDAQIDATPGAEQPYGLKLRLVDKKPPALHTAATLPTATKGPRTATRVLASPRAVCCGTHQELWSPSRAWPGQTISGAIS